MRNTITPFQIKFTLSAIDTHKPMHESCKIRQNLIFSRWDSGVNRCFERQNLNCCHICINSSKHLLLPKGQSMCFILRGPHPSPSDLTETLWRNTYAILSNKLYDYVWHGGYKTTLFWCWRPSKCYFWTAIVSLSFWFVFMKIGRASCRERV